MGTEHEEINPLTVGQTKWESDLWPSEGLFSNFFLNKKWKTKKNNRFADWLIELANGSFSLSTDGFFKSVKKLLSKEVEIYTVLRQQARKEVSEFHHFFIRFPYIKLSSSQYTILPIKIYCVQTGIFCKNSLQWPHRDQSAGGGVVVIRSCSYQIQIKSYHQSALEQASVAVWRNVEKNTYTVLQINISKYFIGKNKQNFVFFVSFFFRSFFFLSISLTLISRWRRLFSPPYRVICYVLFHYAGFPDWFIFLESNATLLCKSKRSL